MTIRNWIKTAAICMANLAVCTGVHAAERKVGQRPEYGVVTVATIGSPLLERFDVLIVKGAMVLEDVNVSLGMQGKIAIPANTVLSVQRLRPLEACTEDDDAYSDRIIATGDACLKDTDMDGTFDRAEGPVVFSSRKMKQPIAYQLVDIPIEGRAGLLHGGNANFRQVLTFLGAAAGTLRVSYREFSNDMARPAFTEELTFPLESTYPQTITWRDTKFVLLGLSSDGLRYRVERVR